MDTWPPLPPPARSQLPLAPLPPFSLPQPPPPIVPKVKTLLESVWRHVPFPNLAVSSILTGIVACFDLCLLCAHDKVANLVGVSLNMALECPTHIVRQQSMQCLQSHVTS